MVRNPAPAREVYLEWEPEARAMLGRFRLTTARYPDDPDVRALIADLQRDSVHVRDWWPRYDVAPIGGNGRKSSAIPGSVPSTTPT
jgi:MmyB-like transcription regulator ligand binding domain